eukprot:CAMPEP_0184364368 /NCGR_PEP_ID=MMETSP1089-20130417/144000_1 /TAXON_ID=38269 ORGANISM="Gloeochaete wittrockiana, Strain SAG46.84" /NCGR_SAMPLE_ID=MMETSP1089 /ASSEMBLY_ACC=CAM_ASM_000445 /LENGTH=288 /DNA_ID=CAMNT_0026705237 /DNA_START=65 /DNA_END=927 /DNA_ORIENTATION=-
MLQKIPSSSQLSSSNPSPTTGALPSPHTSSSSSIQEKTLPCSLNTNTSVQKPDEGQNEPTHSSPARPQDTMLQQKGVVATVEIIPSSVEVTNDPLPDVLSPSATQQGSSAGLMQETSSPTSKDMSLRTGDLQPASLSSSSSQHGSTVSIQPAGEDANNTSPTTPQDSSSNGPLQKPYTIEERDTLRYPSTHTSLTETSPNEVPGSNDTSPPTPNPIPTLLHTTDMVVGLSPTTAPDSSPANASPLNPTPAPGPEKTTPSTPATLSPSIAPASSSTVSFTFPPSHTASP